MSEFGSMTPNKLMSEEKVLTNEIAEQFITGETLDLSEFTSIEDAAAESLSKHQGDLWLSGLTKLSDAAAENLSKHKGYLIFECLTELSDAAAESFSKHKGELQLSGLTELSQTGEKSLSKNVRVWRKWRKKRRCLVDMELIKDFRKRPPEERERTEE